MDNIYKDDGLIVGRFFDLEPELGEDQNKEEIEKVTDEKTTREPGCCPKRKSCD